MSLHLRRTRDQVEDVALLTAHLESLGGGRVSLDAVLGDADRRARRRIAPGRAVRRAWAWERDDRDDATWIPQGVAHSWHTGYGGADADPGVLLVSWYSTRGEGARISVVDLASGRYRHVLLVEPTLLGRMRPALVHAGGLVWHGHWLHVAATRLGFLTFDLEDLLHDPTEELGYAYVLPVRAVHQSSAAEPDERLRFSFLSLDRTERSPSLVVGEIGRQGRSTRLARFALDESGELVTSDDGSATPIDLGEGPAQMQGAVVIDGVYYVSISHGRRTWGEMAVGRPGEWKRIRWATPPGPEDLTFHPPSGLIWSVSEHPGRRWIFGMRRRWFGQP